MEEIQKRADSEDQVVWEIKTAIALGKTIVPLLISGAAMPIRRFCRKKFAC
jgi:hypothetical protein